MKTLVLIVAFSLSGCAVVGAPAAEKVADGVAYYCENENYNARLLYRQTVNSELSERGHSITINCSGDDD